ncbi:hypothetical protein MTR_6g013185 [Medicago truncatula]|uniref:Uncharacterized protein n=1 Tax=Medicago truncatula TaxID=3880 RepID=A0A072U7D3_MEDTR|nr:hypothetical protein MTR_6g013185 [Medicago truncatula]
MWLVEYGMRCSISARKCEALRQESAVSLTWPNQIVFSMGLLLRAVVRLRYSISSSHVPVGLINQSAIIAGLKSIIKLVSSM